MRALVIDDSRATRRAIGSIMKELGFQITEAENGQEGLDRLREHGVPDIVLVDWNMPVMNGLEFIKETRKSKAYLDLPLMMVTTETEMSRLAEAFIAGVNEYLMKPFDADMVREKLMILGIEK